MEKLVEEQLINCFFTSPLALFLAACSRGQSTQTTAQPTVIPTPVNVVTIPSQVDAPTLKADVIKDSDGAPLLVSTLIEDTRCIKGGSLDDETARFDELDKVLDRGGAGRVDIRSSYTKTEGESSASVTLSSYSEVENELVRMSLERLVLKATASNLDLEKILISISNPNSQASVTVETVDYVKGKNISNYGFGSDGFHGPTGITPSASLSELVRIRDLIQYEDPSRIGLELWIRNLDYDPINKKPEQAVITIQVLQ